MDLFFDNRIVQWQICVEKMGKPTDVDGPSEARHKRDPESYLHVLIQPLPDLAGWVPIEYGDK